MDMEQLENYRLNYYNVKDQLKDWVYSRSVKAFDQGDRIRDAIQTREQLEKHTKAVREQFIASLGGLPPMDTPLSPEIAGEVVLKGFSIRKIVFQSRPRHYVTGHLYVPDSIASPRGAVLFLSGHEREGKQAPMYQKVCRQLVRSGLIVFAIDPIGQGERLSYYDPARGESTVRWGTYEHDYTGFQCWALGDSLAKYFVHDAMRAIDYLSSLPEVDPGRIGVTGNSGGGLQTAMVMLCDPRIAAAAPATFIMNRRSYLYSGQAQDAEQIWPNLSAYGVDHEDLIMAMVPRPVQILAVQYDFFPIEGTRQTVERTRRYWELYGKTDHIQLVEDSSIHQYTAKLAQAASDFFAEHLLGKGNSFLASAVDTGHTLNSSELNCTSSGQVKADYPDAEFVYELNKQRLLAFEQKRSLPSREEQSRKAVEWLRAQVMAGRLSCDLNPRLVPLENLDELTVHSAFWWSQQGLFNHAFLFRSVNCSRPTAPVTIGLWDGGTSRLQGRLNWIRDNCSQGRQVMVLDVTGTGALQPNPVNGRPLTANGGTLHKLMTDLLWLGDSMAAVRVYDVIRAMDMAQWLMEGQDTTIPFYACGKSGMYALLAKALDPRLSDLETDGSLESLGEWVQARHYDIHDRTGLILPGMLQYFDLPDIDHMAAAAK